MDKVIPTIYFVEYLEDGTTKNHQPPSRKYPKMPIRQECVPRHKKIIAEPPQQFTRITELRAKSLGRQLRLMLAQTYPVFDGKYSVLNGKAVNFGYCYHSNKVRFSLFDDTSFVNFEAKTFSAFLNSDHIHLWKLWKGYFIPTEAEFLRNIPEIIFLKDSNVATSVTVIKNGFERKLFIANDIKNNITLNCDELQYIFGLRGFLEQKRIILEANKETVMRYYAWYIGKCKEKRISYLLEEDFMEPLDPTNTTDFVQLFNDIGNLTAVFNKERFQYEIE